MTVGQEFQRRVGVNWTLKDGRSFPDRITVAVGKVQKRGRRNVLDRGKRYSSLKKRWQ